MRCPRCQHENGPQAKFCQECAVPLARTCAKCGSELPSTAKFCPECAHPAADAVAITQGRLRSPETYTPKHLAEKILTFKTALEGERKQVTVLFADLKGSMELLADRDPEEARKLLDPVLEHMMEAVRRYEGTVNQVMGDGIMALFGAPVAHEDHAVRACYAALRMQESVKGYAESVRREQGVTLLTAPLAAGAQQAAKIPKIGYLSGFSPEYDNTWLAAFRQGLQDIGYVEGKTILIEERHVSAGRDEKLPELSAQLVRLKVDLLVVAGTPAAHAAKALTNVIPIVMTNAADPVGTGLVTSLARPGGNITGLSDFNTGVVAKRLELLKEVIPSAIRVAALLNPANPTNRPQITLTQTAASALSVTILSFEAERANEITRAFVTMKHERSMGLIVIGDPTLGAHRKLILELAAKNRLPAVYSQSQWVSAGGLMSFGTHFADLYRRAAPYVDRILKGAKPADLPVEQPTKFELVINLKTANALGLTIPPSVLGRADEIIQ